jgi:uncharacterized RDD family membrane protein YckC
MTTEDSTDAMTMAGFWRRFAALLIDGAILGVVGLALGTVFGELFSMIGPWGRLVGFTIALAYFGVLNSRVANGQTLGKKLLRIRVVGGDGDTLPVGRSFIRYVPLGAVWFLNYAQLPSEVLFSPLVAVVSIIVFGLGTSILYLLIFNRRTRQSVHDWLVGSYVVLARSTAAPSFPRTSRRHLVVCAVLVLASGALPLLTSRLAQGEFFAPILASYRAVGAEPWVRHANVSKGKRFGTGTNNETTLNITAWVNDETHVKPERARRLAALALDADPSARNVDVLSVTLIYGYDIGIASSWRSRAIAMAPNDWVTP